VSPIGSGGMGDVYRARDPRLERDVAVKLLLATSAPSAEARARFTREARAVAALQHPNICTLFDVGETADGRAYLVMELLQGETLQQRLLRGPLPVEDVVAFGRDLADALDAAHTAGIVHRDVKPANVFLTPRGPKILDFGVAQRSGGAAASESQAMAATTAAGPLTSPGTAIGTLGYMSPEQLLGRQVDARTDIFSLGLVIYEMATGRAAFQGQTTAALAASILHDTPPAPRTLRPELPASLDVVIAKAIDKDPASRHQRAADLSVDLRRILRGGASDTSPAVRAGRPTGARRVRWVTVAAAVSALALLAYGVRWLTAPAHAALTDTDTLILADFQNTTGDPVFDDTLRQGLAVQLGQSPFLSLVSDQRIRGALRLMGRPEDSALTPAVAREVCERLSSSVVVAGTIAPLGSQYVLGLRASDCRSGDVIDEQQVQASRKEDVLKTLSRMAESFRARVGESAATLAEHAVPLEEATTPSLDALKAFSTGTRLNFANGTVAAAAQFKRALEMDPDFALAEARLALCYSALGEHRLAMEGTRRAYALRDRTSARERFNITFLYERQVTGNLQRAMDTLELWAQTYPRDALAAGFLTGFSTIGTGNFEKAIAAGERAIRLDPDVTYGYTGMAISLLYLDRPVEAAAALDRGGDRLRDFQEAFLVRYHLAFLSGDRAGMQTWAERATGQPAGTEWIAHVQSLVEARAGRFARADQLSRAAQATARQAGFSERAATFAAAPAVWAALSGQTDEARRRAKAVLAQSTGRDVLYGAGLALALAGDWSQLRSLTDDLAQRFPEDTSVQLSYVPTLRGFLALGEGQPARALEALEPSLRNELSVPGLPFNAIYGSLYSAYARGQAYLALKRPRDAAAEFRKIVEHRGIVLEDPVGAWATLQLARALVAAGELDPARSAYRDVLAMWADADPDLAVVKQARAELAKL